MDQYTYQKSLWKADPRKRLLANARRRASDKGLVCNIKTGDIPMPKFCPIFGYELDWSFQDKEKMPTLDRDLNEYGYEPWNLKVICARANRIKSDITPAELKRLADYVGVEKYGLL